jgi:hypothetical protein
MIYGRPVLRAHPGRRHEYTILVATGEWRCACGKPRDDAAVKRGRNNRARGNRGELTAARKYGGEKVGPLGLPEDLRGREWRTQVKTIAGTPPRTWRVTVLWRDVFAQLGEHFDGHRYPRLLLRYRPGATRKIQDYFVVPRKVAAYHWGGESVGGLGIITGEYVVVRGEDWLDWFGKDE